MEKLHENQVIVITGGASGIGLIISKFLDSLGATLVIADINEEAAKKAIEDLPSKKGIAIKCDERVKGLSGCWVGNDKIAATGIAIKNGVTMHGIAINVNPNLEHFGYIIPCGLEDRGVTSMEKLGVSNVSMSEIKEKLKQEGGLL